MPETLPRARSLQARSVVGEDVELRIDSDVFRGWKSFTVRRSLDSVSGSFEASLSTQAGRFPITPGAQVDLWTLREERILSGYVDRIRASISGRDHAIGISGRDRTADLVDCSVDPDGPSEFTDRRPDELVRELARPYGVSVNSRVAGATRIPRFAVQPGETVWSAIERITRIRGMLAYSDGEGDLILERPRGDLARVDLVEGQNVVSADWEWNDSKRFRTYVVRGQRFGTDSENGILVAGPEGSSSDLHVTRPRALVILAEGPVSDADAAERAQWEAAIRATRAVTLRVLVASWRETDSDDAPLWRLNRTVRIAIPSLALVDTDMLLNSVTLTLDEQSGETAELGFVRVGAYAPQPTIPEEDNPLQGLEEGEEEL